MVSTSKTKIIDHQVKETWVIISTQVVYETNHISLFSDSRMSSAQNFCFLCISFIVAQKKQIIYVRRNRNSKKKAMFICEIIFVIILICQKLGLVRPVQNKKKNFVCHKNRQKHNHQLFKINLHLFTSSQICTYKKIKFAFKSSIYRVFFSLEM